MRGKILPLLPALLLLLTLGGCAAGEKSADGPVLWFAGVVEDWDGDTGALEAVAWTGGELTVDGLMSALLAGPARDSGLTSPFPEGTALLGWQLEDGLLRLNLSGEYGALEGVELTLADYCITLTLCQLDGVERVSITVEGRALEGRYRQELSAGDAIFSGVEEEPVEVSAALYFPRAGGRGLGVERRVFQLTEDDVLAEIVTQALIDGPESGDLSAFLPEGTQLLDLRLEDGVCTVNFSQELLDGMPGDEDRQTLVIYAIVNSLGNLSSVESVRLQVEGETLTAYGAVSLPEVLEPDFGLAESG